MKAAGFPREKWLGEFDFDANPNINPATIAQLATGADVAQESLGLTGEADLLESDWQGGRIDADRVLIRVDDLLYRASQGTNDSVPDGPDLLLEALRRPRH